MDKKISDENIAKASDDQASNESKQETPAAAASGAETGGLSEVESPAISPAAEGTAEDAVAKAEDRADGYSAHADLLTHNIIPFVAAPSKHTDTNAGAGASRRSRKFTWLAASVVVGAAFGAMAGVLGVSGVTWLASGPAPQAAPDQTAALQSTLTQLRSEVAALKAGVDASGRTSTTQYNKLVDRFDRVERAQSAAAKADAVKADAALPKEAPASAAAREATGSITPINPSASAQPVAPLPVPAVTPTAVVPGWAVRDVYRGVAMLQSRVGSMVEVGPGDVLPGIGRIEAIRRQDGRWVVITSRGMIVSMR